MENNFQFARWKNTFAAVASRCCRRCLILTLSGKTVASEYKRKAVWVFFFLAFSLLCFILFALVCEGGWEREGEDVLKLRSTTVIVDAWYAQLVVYYCQQQVCVSLLTSPPSPHATKLADCPSAGWRCGRGTALLKSKAAKQTFAAVQEAHTQQTQYSTEREHNKTRVLWRQWVVWTSSYPAEGVMGLYIKLCREISFRSWDLTALYDSGSFSQVSKA